MKRSLESIRKAELLATRLRWVVILACVAFTWGHIPVAILAVILAGLTVSNVVAYFMCSDSGRFVTTGKRLCAALRLLDGLAVAGSGIVPSLRYEGLWLLGIPILCVEALVSRRWQRVASMACLFGAVQGCTLVLGGVSGRQAFFPIFVLCAGAVGASVLANYQSRDELLGSHDRRLFTLMNSISAMNSTGEIRKSLLHALRSAVEDLSATAGYVSLVDEESGDLITEAAFATTGEFAFPERVSIGAGVSGYVVKMGQPISIAGSPGHNLECDGIDIEVRSAVSVPLLAHGYSGPGKAMAEHVVGAMTIVNAEAYEPVAQEELEILRSLASLMASTVTNARMEEKQRAIFLRTLESLATALEARDDYTRGHSQRVCEVSMVIGQNLGLGTEALEELRIGTILHDIGKIGVPDAILNKPGRLTDEEFLVMKSHTTKGYEICKPLMLSEGILMIIRNHHEKLDGSGYPDGLRGGELPLSLRIVCVADAFDAMSSRRPYRGVMDLGDVIAELSKGAGVQFDPVVVESLRALLASHRIDPIYVQCWDAQRLRTA